MKFGLSEEQVLSLAFVIKDDISSFVQNHKAEYEKFLAHEENKRRKQNEKHQKQSITSKTRRKND